MAVEYILTHVGGLEEIVRDELAQRVPEAAVCRSEYGRQHVLFSGPPASLLSLRTIENVYVAIVEISDVAPGKHWLQELERILATIDFAPAVNVLRQIKPVPAAPSFRVTAERFGEHEFRSPEVAAAAGAGVVAATGWRVDLTGFDIEVRVDIHENQAQIGLRLSEKALHRRSRVRHPRVTLNPTVAAALVRLSHPQPNELVVDPMMGGGTLLTERYYYDPHVQLLGGDKFAEKVQLAQQNFAALGVPARLIQWDVTRLPLPSESVDKFLVNPPWGRLSANRQLNQRLYPAMLAQMRRCLRPEGRLVVLTCERALLRRFRNQFPDMHLLYIKRLTLSGLEPSIHVFVKER